MKKLFFALIFLLLFFVYAQNPQKPDEPDMSWRYMARAEAAYETENYSEATKLAVMAQNKRKKETEWAVFILEQSLKPIEVQKAGENLADVIAILTRRDDYDGLEIIDTVLKKIPVLKVPYTVSQIKKEVIQSWIYPEADFLLGKLYMFQGEYVLAESYFTEAWKNVDKLNIPDQKYDILYETASLAVLCNNSDTYEKTLLLIIADAGNKIAGIDSPFARSILQAIKRGIALDDFFMLYRHDFFMLISAYNQLAAFYHQNDDNEKALSYAALGVLSSFTRLYQAIKERNDDYRYTTFSDFQKNIIRYQDITLWSVKNEVWRALYTFSMILKANNYTDFSRSILLTLSQNCPEEYWKRVAFKEIFNNNN